MLIEAVKQTALILLIVYLTIGLIAVVTAYLVSKKKLSITDHFANISFLVMWLPYFYIYNKKYKD